MTSDIQTLTFNENGEDLKFKFLIKELCEKDFRIYIKHTPKDMTIFGCHKAHYLCDSYGKYICWDRNIKSLDDAYAILYYWSKNYIKDCYNKC